MDLNPYLIIVYGGIVVSLLFIFFFNRDRKNTKTWLGRHKMTAFVLILLLAFGAGVGMYARFIEPYALRIHRVSIPMRGITEPVTLAVIADLHVGDNKKAAWIQKVANTIISVQPDAVVMAGDYTVNDGSVADESVYLYPLREVSRRFPIVAVLGNHEYGYKGYGYQTNFDKSKLVRARLKALKIPVLINELKCPTIRSQKICFFGTDDVYREQTNFSSLEHRPAEAPVIQVSHNPDGILFWPLDQPLPDLEISGHTHGGQLWLPFFGPLGRVQSWLGTDFYRWLNYWKGVPIFTTVGTSESGAPLRLFTPPEVAVLRLFPQH